METQWLLRKTMPLQLVLFYLSEVASHSVRHTVTAVIASPTLNKCHKSPSLYRIAYSWQHCFTQPCDFSYRDCHCYQFNKIPRGALYIINTIQIYHDTQKWYICMHKCKENRNCVQIFEIKYILCSSIKDLGAIKLLCRNTSMDQIDICLVIFSYLGLLTWQGDIHYV